MPAEQRVPADGGADADPHRAADQLTVQPHLNAVRPALLMQFEQGI
jgi:hypothetical protein